MASYTITKKIPCCDFFDLSENLKAEVKEKYFLDTVHFFLKDELEIFSNEISNSYGVELCGENIAYDVVNFSVGFTVKKVTYPDFFLSKIVENEEFLNFLINECSHYQFKIDYGGQYDYYVPIVSFSFYCENEGTSDEYQERVYKHVEKCLESFCAKINSQISEIIIKEYDYVMSDEFIKEYCEDNEIIFDPITGELHYIEEMGD